MSGAGGSRPLTGRRTDPVRKHFEKIQTPENLGKANIGIGCCELHDYLCCQIS